MATTNLQRIVVGSVNEAKFEACKAVCHSLFHSFHLGSQKTEGLPNQPIGYEETRECALIRARSACKSSEKCDYGIGLEGGVSHDGWLINCAAVVSKTGIESHVYGVSFPLPHEAAIRILFKKEEMGPVMDEIFAKEGSSKSESGAIGELTSGIVTRGHMWQVPLVCAFIPFLQPKLYSTDLSNRVKD